MTECISTKASHAVTVFNAQHKAGMARQRVMAEHRYTQTILGNADGHKRGKACLAPEPLKRRVGAKGRPSSAPRRQSCKCRHRTPWGPERNEGQAPVASPARSLMQSTSCNKRLPPAHMAAMYRIVSSAPPPEAHGECRLGPVATRRRYQNEGFSLLASANQASRARRDCSGSHGSHTGRGGPIKGGGHGEDHIRGFGDGVGDPSLPVRLAGGALNFGFAELSAPAVAEARAPCVVFPRKAGPAGAGEVAAGEAPGGPGAPGGRT